MFLTMTKLIYDGMVEDIPEPLGKWRYSHIEGMNPLRIYVYDEGKNKKL